MRPEKVFQVCHPSIASEFPPLKSLDNHPHNLPLQPTPFIGREKELAALDELVARETVRLVTLTGAGGAGKTRLALQAAADLIERFGDGTWVVDLAPVDTAPYVIPAVARTLGVRESSGRPALDLLRELTRGREMLLVLDNVEQIEGVGPVVVQLLGACPSLKLLVTSREALHVRGEQVFPVPPLTVPRIREAARVPLSRLTQYEAVALFIDRARAVQPAFSVTNDTAPAVAELCARLDGLPLAIELAAARIPLLPPAAILERLGQRLRFLAGGISDLPHRQRTLRAAIDWSYRLLAPLEQTLFREAAVFSGGASLEAVEKVCACAGEEETVVLDTLSALVAKSLLARESGAAEPRFSMMETIREFGLELLGKTGGTEALRDAHARYYAQRAEELRTAQDKPRLRGAAIGGFRADHDNFQAALDWLDAARRGEDELRLCVALGGYWRVQGHLSVGSANLDRAVAASPSAAPNLRAEALLAAAGLAGDRGDYDASLSRAREALELAEAAGAAVEASQCRIWMGEMLRLRGDLPEARERFSAVLAAAAGKPTVLAVQALDGLGLVDWQEGRGDAARGRLEECRRMADSIGERALQARAAGNLAVLDYGAGRTDQALAGFDEARRILEEIGDVEGTIVAFNNVGTVYAKSGRHREALSSYERVAALARETGNDRWLSRAHAGIADAWRGQGDVARALEEARKSEAMARRLGECFELGLSERALGDAQLAAGQSAAARVSFEHALALLENRGDKEELDAARRGLERSRLVTG
jgi:predicted ATPase/predicted negative regulator of RcsB-dependent stress response